MDFCKVKPTEREKANRLASSAAGAALENDLLLEMNSSAENGNTKTFVPGEGLPEETLDLQSYTTSFTKEQQEQIRELLSKAASLKEVDEIESQVKRGIFPKIL